VTTYAAAPQPWWEHWAQQYEARPRRQPTPGALAAALDPTTHSSAALDVIDAELAELADGHGHDALAVFMPPQEGKSQRCSRRFPEWLLDHNQGLRVAIVSYELDLATRWGRDIKNDVHAHRCPRGAVCEDPGCRRLHIDIRQDSRAAARWETPVGGGIYCVGIGGALTGRPVDVLIVDDPVKDRAAAESKTIRDSTWDWWENVALTRLAPGAKVVLVQTRWHEDDLAGRIAARPSPLRWRTVKIPAIAEAGDRLGRAEGEELASVRGREPGHFRRFRDAMSHYVFSGVYQQSPTAAEGNFFRRPSFRYWRPAQAWPDGRPRIECEGRAVTLADCWRFATMDLAVSTRTTADYTVCAVWAVDPAGNLILLDRTRDRIEEHDHFGMVEALRTTWGFDTVYVEQQYIAATVVKDARAAGIPVAPLIADTDKVTRAVPAAGRVHAGKVWFPAEVSWLDEWCDELAAFPQAGVHDDQVDVLSYAARVLTQEWTPARPPELPKATALAEHERVLRAALAAGTGGAAGSGNGELDIMNVPT
jgi:predicted phage terminase large subunit-like protein